MKLTPRHKRQQRLWPSRILLAIFCTFLIVSVPAYSQDANTVLITGKVSLASNTGDLSGTTVQVKGESKGVTTDAQGNFSIRAPKSATIVFSRIGSKAVEIKLNGQTIVNVTLEAADNSLDQVVVVSYGKQRQRNITGAITRVNATEMQDIPAAEFGQKLNGKVAGLQINQVTGRPGQAMTFRLRGASSLNSGNQPLIVVDGQPIGDINLLNPDDIESFSVLKDASATALYGSRAANGVILITTKQAKVGRSNVNLSSYYGWQSVPKRGRPDMMNGTEFAQFMNEFYTDVIRYDSLRDLRPTDIPEDYRDPARYGKGTDWYDALLRTAPIQNHSINVTSGTEKVLSSITATYFNQEGTMRNTGMERFSFRANNEFRPNNKIKLGFNIAPSYQIDKNTRGNTDGNRQILVLGLINSPILPRNNPDGSIQTKGSSFGMYPMANAYHQLQVLEVNQKTFRMLGNAYANVELIDGLNFRTTINLDLGSGDYNSFNSSQYGGFGAAPPNPNISAAHSSYNYTSWLNENILTYNFSIKEDHNFDLLAGYSAQKTNRNTRGVNGSNYPNDAVHLITNAAAVNSGSTGNTAWTMASWYGRLNYDFRNKYFLTAAIRRDGSSRFGRNEQWGYFPSASVGWVVSDESFFPKSNALSFLKLRASYGLTGNNNIGDYTSVSTLSATPYVFDGVNTTPGFSITSLGNPELTWETSKQLDIGLEASLINDRLTFGYDYYLKNTEDLLYRINLPMASGYSSVFSNVGSFRMWGHEFTLSSRNLTGELKWNTSFNISFMDNKVISLQDNVPIGGVNKYNDYNKTAVGRRIGELYGYVFDGIYMTMEEFNKQPKHATSLVGTTRMKDVDGNGFIDGSDRTYIGNPNPKYIFGITNDLRYKNFDFTVVISGQGGNDILNTNMQNLVNIDGIFNVTKDMANRWRSLENPGNGKVPRTKANTTELYRLANTNWISRGDYLTVRNITLGYTLDAARIKYFKSARVYVSMNQAFVFTRYKGQNPEVNDSRDQATTAGQDNGSYPVPRMLLIGANINF